MFFASLIAGKKSGLLRTHLLYLLVMLYNLTFNTFPVPYPVPTVRVLSASSHSDHIFTTIVAITFLPPLLPM